MMLSKQAKQARKRCYRIDRQKLRFDLFQLLQCIKRDGEDMQKFKIFMQFKQNTLIFFDTAIIKLFLHQHDTKIIKCK